MHYGYIFLFPVSNDQIKEHIDLFFLYFERYEVVFDRNLNALILCSELPYSVNHSRKSSQLKHDVLAVLHFEASSKSLLDLKQQEAFSLLESMVNEDNRKEDSLFLKEIEVRKPYV